MSLILLTEEESNIPYFPPKIIILLIKTHVRLSIKSATGTNSFPVYRCLPSNGTYFQNTVTI